MRYRIEGTTDEVTSCDCCGRTRLKHTVALLDTDTDQVRYMGVTCAAHALKIPSADVKTQAKQADDKVARIKRQQQDEQNRARQQRWVSFLIERTGGIFDFTNQPDILAMIQALGGYKEARAGFQG